MGLGADQLKRAAALRALEFVRDGMVLGLGSGSTAEVWLEQLGRRVQAGLKIVGVPTSRKTEALARRLGVPLASLEDFERLDVTVDGADEIDPRTLDVIKGRGGSLLREKLVAIATEQEIIIAEGSKLVSRLGERQAVPVEVVRFGWRQTASALEQLGCEPELRLSEESPVVSDEGHYILDCRFPPIAEPQPLAREIKALTGVVEHGLFLGLAHRLIIADESGVKVLERRNTR
jgi:ribose 5-phosphate isomerase A